MLNMANEILAFVYYALAVLAPFLLFSCVSSACQEKNGPVRSLTVMVSLYVSKVPLILCLYHLLLTVGLAAFSVQQVTENMSVAVDLNYYTKTSIRATEAYDAIQDGKYSKSFYNWFFHLGGDGGRRLEEKYKDVVAIYHSSDSWDNVITAQNIIDICKAEKLFLTSQPCVGSEVSSVIESIMTPSCSFKTSFAESRHVFGLAENALYVEDSINPWNPKSSVVLSYYSTSCKLKLKSVDSSVSAVESSYGATTHMAYAHTDLVTDAFIAAGINDVELSLIAMVVCFGVLSLSVGLKFLFGLLFMLCIILSLTIAAGTLPLFGFSYFSAFNVLAIFVITGVGADAIIVFCSSWNKSFASARMETLSRSLMNDCQHLLGKVNMLPLFPLVLYNAYTNVVSALSFTVMTTVLSFMANLVSPIVVIAQLGSFMGISMIMYFTLLHLVLIPAWVFVMKMDQCVKLCSPCLSLWSNFGRCCKLIMPSTVPDSYDLTRIHNQNDVIPERETQMVPLRDTERETQGPAPAGDNAWCVVPHATNEMSRVDDYSVCSDDESEMLGGNDDETGLRRSIGNDSNISNRELEYTDIYEESEVNPANVKRKQGLWLGCSVFLGVIAAMLFVAYGITEVIDTDFGLPMLFKEGTNMADLMYVAKNFKSDILTLGNSGGSSTPPNPGTFDPTSMPTTAPTPRPTRLTMSPTSCPSAMPSVQPTCVPTALPTSIPTVVPTSVPTSSPTVVPTGVPTSSPTVVPTGVPTSLPTLVPTGVPTSSPTFVPTSVPTSSPTVVPTVEPTSSPTVVPTNQPTMLPTAVPTGVPVLPPSGVPSQAPVVVTALPSSAPSLVPTSIPTFTLSPSLVPSISVSPSKSPSDSPSLTPTTPALSSSPSSTPSADPSSTPSGLPSDTPSAVPSSEPSSTPFAVPSSEPTSTPSGVPSGSPSPFPSSEPTSNPSNAPSSEPTSNPSGTPSSEPTSNPSSTPSSEPTSNPSNTPSSEPTSSPSSLPSQTPSSSPTGFPTARTLSPSLPSELTSTDITFYTVYICYGIDIEKDNVDSAPKAKVDPESFGRYAEAGGLLSDLKLLCDYLASNKVYMEVAMHSSECLYNQLMAVTDDPDVSIFERIGLWMAVNKERLFQVGVEETGQGMVSGNFGEELDLWLTWICQPISCEAEVSSFFHSPQHALTMIDRWDGALYDVGSVSAKAVDVVPLTGSEAWLFPLLSSRIVSSIYISSAISFVGCLVLIGIATRNFKLSLLIGVGMLFVMITSLLLHAVFFSSVIDLIDVIVIISFVGIIIDYPTHMAFHYQQDLKLRKNLARDGVVLVDGHEVMTAQEEEDHFHKHSFGYMRFALIGPAVTTIFSALPLMFAEFSIISKAGEYVVIMCVCTYFYVAFVMPTLLRLVGEVNFVPCRYNTKDSFHFI